MADPRYRQDKRDPKSERLAQLAAIAQIYQGMQGPQMRQESDQRQNALAVLGLLMQQQGQQDQLKQRQSESDARSGEFWGGTYPMQQQEIQQKQISQQQAHEIALGQLANQGAGIAYGAANQHTARELEAQKLKASQEALARSGQQDTFKTIMSGPNPDVTQALRFLPQDQQPIVQGIHQENVARETEKHRGAISALTDPKMRDMYLGSINVHPDVRANLLQAAVPQAVAPVQTLQQQPSPLAVALPQQQAPQLISTHNAQGQPVQVPRQAGWLDSIDQALSVFLDPAKASPEQKALWEQKRLRDQQLLQRR